MGGSCSLAETSTFIVNTDAALASRPDAFLKIDTAADLVTAKQSGRLGVIYDTQGTIELGTKADNVGVLGKLGVRVFQLTYNKAALVGDGCLEPRNAGLSDFGHDVITAIQSARCLLDLSHAGRRTAAEAIAASKVRAQSLTQAATP